VKYQDGQDHAGTPASLATGQMICAVCGGKIHSSDYAQKFTHGHAAVASQRHPDRCAICGYPLGDFAQGPHSDFRAI
jgi:hypothetical protein